MVARDNVKCSVQFTVIIKIQQNLVVKMAVKNIFI